MCPTEEEVASWSLCPICECFEGSVDFNWDQVWVLATDNYSQLSEQAMLLLVPSVQELTQDLVAIRSGPLMSPAWDNCGGSHNMFVTMTLCWIRGLVCLDVDKA